LGKKNQTTSEHVADYNYSLFPSKLKLQNNAQVKLYPNSSQIETFLNNSKLFILDQLDHTPDNGTQQKTRTIFLKPKGHLKC